VFELQWELESLLPEWVLVFELQWELEFSLLPEWVQELEHQ
jgi:hypothetical protein